MSLSSFLQGLATQSGPDRLKGAVVLVALDRPIDNLIQQAQGLGPYHRGEKSPWSHTFLMADVFSAVLDSNKQLLAFVAGVVCGVGERVLPAKIMSKTSALIGGVK